MKKILFALLLLTTPAHAALVPNNGGVIVYGDFEHSSFGGYIQAYFSYSFTGGVFDHYYNVTDPLNLPGQIVIGVDINGRRQLTSIGCNAFDAHCGRNNVYNPTVTIFGMGDEGFISISSFVNVIGATPVELSLFINLPTGFSFTAPQIAAVPEVSTWIMMLLGFAGIAAMGARKVTSRSNMNG